MRLNRFALEPEGHPPHLLIEAVGADFLANSSCMGAPFMVLTVRGARFA